MRVVIPKESRAGERRVAATPDSIARLGKMGFEVVVEAGAGNDASFPDTVLTEAGAQLEADRSKLLGSADLVLMVNPPTEEEIRAIRSGATVISFFRPEGDDCPQMKAMMEQKITMLSIDFIPRISRAQKMDGLSSMANISGYRAVLEAAAVYGSFFTGQFTAAGKVAPAKVLVVGAGVAGLAALGAATGLGAIVRAFDVRASVKDQIKSLGGEFLEVELEESGDGGGGYARTMSPEYHKAQMELFYQQAQDVDIVITTALIPGRDAPVLWERRHVEAMKPGSVIVDLAASKGGNCELTQPGEHVTVNGVHILGYTDLTSRLPKTASELYSSNLCHLLDDLGGAEKLVQLDFTDEVVRGCCLLHGGSEPELPELPEAPVTQAKPTPEPKPQPERVVEVDTADAASEEASGASAASPMGWVICAVLMILWIVLRAQGSPPESAGHGGAFLQHLTVFVLACFVGWQVIWSVTAALHTPLMSVTNAISGIIIVGGILTAAEGLETTAGMLGLAAVLFATINIAGGFLVTQRMLKMFRK